MTIQLEGMKAGARLMRKTSAWQAKNHGKPFITSTTATFYTGSRTITYCCGCANNWY